jgi:hypothetical protein
LLFSRALSSKMANGLLLRVCPWWTGHKSRMFEGATGSCDVVGIQIGMCIGGGATVRALACITLGDGPGIGTLGFSMVGDGGCSTLGDEVTVALGFIVPWWRIGRRTLRSF